jgi:methyl-accepting chemotaxis protein
MKNLKVSAKLIVAFLTVIALTAAVGAAGAIGLMTLTAASDDMYDYNLVPLPYMSKAIETMQRLRVSTRDYAVGASTHDFEMIQAAQADIESYTQSLTESFDQYAATLTDADADAKTLFQETRTLYETQYLPVTEELYNMAVLGSYQLIVGKLAETKATTDTIAANLDECMSLKVASAADANAANDRLAVLMLILILSSVALAVSVALFLAAYISGLISKPLRPLTAFMQKAGHTGDLSLSENDRTIIGTYSRRRDEIGQLIAASAAYNQRVEDAAKMMENIAGGDLTAELPLLSDKDTMGLALRAMTENLNEKFGDIQASTALVATGSKQIADGAQTLAQGSTEQAAAVQELSTAIAEIADKTKNNAEMAGKAAALASTIKQNAEKGSSQMGQMTQAVKEINDASQAISKVIKTIDDIAFQTNILALNAAVEAARAGQHGKGFAVVAEEVRSLASKSAAAAKDTGALIQNSMEKAGLGAKIAGETAASLGEIVSGIHESSALVGDIAKSSEEQRLGIAQINRGIDQVAQVVQQNSATAEQSAAASEEMSGQSAMLEELISQFRLKRTRAAGPRLGAKPSAKISLPEGLDAPGGGYGKY